ncbi:hypothetical protein EQV77_00735 [Halobacillus fulvus]|nr:hypothetical protein EQV77_00735 [Halobacillus fulvus]
MKKKIFERFNEYKKWKDYINPTSFEVKITVLVTVIFVVGALTLKTYDHFDSYYDFFKTLTLSVAQALIGVLGVIIAGVAIIISVLKKEIIETIESINKNKSGNKLDIGQLLVSFEFLAFNVGIGIFFYLSMYFILFSPYQLVNKFIFYTLLFVLSYLLFFIIFYSISLISNIVRFFYIANLYDEISNSKRNLYNTANEIRIDFILKEILKNSNLSQEEFLTIIQNYVDATNVDNKEEIKNYFKEYYK